MNKRRFAPSSPLWFAAALTGALAIAPVAWAAESPAVAPTLVIPRLPAAAPGGDLRARWKNRGLLLSALSSDELRPPPFAQFGATARVAFDDQGVWALIEVSDSSPVEPDDATKLHEWDSAELLVHGRDAKGGHVQLVMAPGRTPAQSRSRQQLLDYRSRALRTELGLPTGTTRVEVSPTGYLAELLIPWRNFSAAGSAPPKEGDTVGVRVSVNGRAEGQRTRQRLLLSLPGSKYDFFALPAATLGKQPAGAPSAVSWGGYDEEIASTLVNVIAAPALAGRLVTIADSAAIGAKGPPLATGKLLADGARARAALSFPAPIGNAKRGPLQVSIAGKPVDTLSLSDPQAERQRLFRAGASQGNALAGGRSGGGRGGAGFGGGTPDWAVPSFGGALFRETAFPAFGYPDPARAQRVFGDVTFKTVFYDANRKPVERPSAPGRYGAVVTATAADGTSATSYHTLIADPGKADRDWWHALRKATGDAVKYEYFVRTPAAYDADKSKKWPLIVFLHGSGGGDKMENVRDSGPQEAAQSRPNFPFIVLSLRSPGGWHPPAVKDVIDEVAGKYRIDPDRITLTGFSMGGMGTWEVVFDQPRRFAAIAPVGGRRGHPERAAEIRQVPAWVWNGAEDGTTTAADAKEAVAALKAAGATVTYTEIPGAGHTDSHDFVYKGTELYDWLLKQKRRP